MTTKLIITNIKSRLENLSSNIAIEIMNALSFKTPNYWFSSAYKSGYWDGYTRFFDRPGNVFPTGLLPIVLDILKKNDIECTVEDTRDNIRINPVPKDYIMNSGKVLRDYQFKTANDIITNELYDIPFTRGVLNIATNGGKTVIAESIIHQILPEMREHEHLLFLTHSKEIGYQAKSSLENDLGISIGFIGDGKWDLENVTVALIPTLYRRRKDKTCKDLMKSTIAFVGDEIHHSTSTSWYTVLNTMINATIRIGLTGTVDTENEINEHRLYATTGTIISKISNQFLIEQGYSAKPTCFFATVDKPELEGKDYQTAYDLGIVNNEKRNDLIVEMVKRERNLDSNILILVERTQHGEILLDKIKKLPNSGRVEFTHGEKDTDYRTNVLKDLKNGKVQVLIATSVLDEGVDVDNINSVIYARGMKSTRKILQGIGRGLRKKEDGSGLSFYDFIDDTHKDLLGHTLERYETMKNEGFEIKKFE